MVVRLTHFGPISGSSTGGVLPFSDIVARGNFSNSINPGDQPSLDKRRTSADGSYNLTQLLHGSTVLVDCAWAPDSPISFAFNRTTGINTISLAPKCDLTDYTSLPVLSLPNPRLTGNSHTAVCDGVLYIRYTSYFNIPQKDDPIRQENLTVRFTSGFSLHWDLLTVVCAVHN